MCAADEEAGREQKRKEKKNVVPAHQCHPHKNSKACSRPGAIIFLIVSVLRHAAYQSMSGPFFPLYATSISSVYPYHL